MKKVFALISLTLPFGMFAQGNFNINPPPQAQNVNYYNQIDETNNSLGNTQGKMNDDINPVQTNIAVQTANPPTQQGSQSGENFSGTGQNDNVQNKKPYCKECEEVKKAIAAAHASSGSSHHKKSPSLKKWGERFSYNTNVKMKKLFARKYKAKTSYEICFLWH
jgi:hypothetical protein